MEDLCPKSKPQNLGLKFSTSLSPLSHFSSAERPLRAWQALVFFLSLYSISTINRFRHLYTLLSLHQVPASSVSLAAEGSFSQFHFLFLSNLFLISLNIVCDELWGYHGSLLDEIKSLSLLFGFFFFWWISAYSLNAQEN